MSARSLPHPHGAGGRQPLPSPTLPDRDATKLVEWLGDVSTEHVVVFGRGLDLICALLHAGAAEATLRCSHERLEPQMASLVIVPALSSTDWLAAALPHIRRTLVATGRLVLEIGPPAGQQQENAIRRQLKLHGFCAVHVSRVDGHVVITAEVPAFDLRRVV